MIQWKYCYNKEYATEQLLYTLPQGNQVRDHITCA